MKKAFIGLTIASAIVSGAVAEDLLSLKTTGVVVVYDQKGNEIGSRPVKKARPGDIIRYEILAQAKGDIKDVAIIGKVPKGTEFIKVETSDYLTEYSLDCKRFSLHPKIKVKENGKVVEKEAPKSMYRCIRWRIPEMGKGEEITFKYDVKIK